MRRLAMRFRGILRGHDTELLDRWLHDAHHSGVYAMQRFARTLQQDLDAVRNALTEPWSNGQTEGQISRLKTLKRGIAAAPAPLCCAPGCCRCRRQAAPRLSQGPILP